jgi:HD-GYP domain-containing protein (c-di-GMP phosphodiesterase class II)
VREKKGVYSEEDWQVMAKHTIDGFKTIFGIKDLDEQLMRAAIVAFEHHLRFDMSGYPKVRHLPSQDFYSKIVAIAEWFDALTSVRSYAGGYRSPDYAVKTLLEKSGTELDPALVKIFVSMMGAYPVGSFVVLDSGEIGIVVQPHGVLLKRPRVIVISDAVKPFMVDLSKKGEDGRYLRTVKRTLDPNEYKIDYTSYFYSGQLRYSDPH